MRAHGDRSLTTATLFLYPTALKAEGVLHERARIAPVLLGDRVTTFPELTDALARDLGVTARVLEPEMAAVVLARALDGPGVPATFRAPRRGLVHELLRVIGELEAAYLAPEDVRAMTAALAPGPAATRLAELARVYAAYATSLARLGAVDRRGREWRVCEGLAAAEAAGTRPVTLAGVERIVFAELYDFSVLQFLIATSLIRIVGDAELVAFAHPENVDATRFLERTWNRFVGDPAIADQVLPSFVVRGGRAGSIAATLRGVFTSGPRSPVAGDGSIRVVVAPSRYGEVEAAVRDVRRRLEQGERPERIAILARDLALYGDAIEDVCRRYRVPVYFRKGKPLVANGLVSACLNLVRCVLEGFPCRRLEALLDGDYFARVPRGGGRTLRAVGFVAETARPLAECVVHHVAGLAPEHRSRAERAGARLGRLIDRLRALDASRTVEGHALALRRTLRRLGLRPVAEGEELPPTAWRDARAWERLEETLAVLGGLTRALGGGPVPLAEFVALLVAALEPLEVEDPAQRTGSVRALSVLDARGLDFDAIYLLGLDDGTFPAPRAESPLWPDAMKRETSAAAVACLRRKLGPRGEGLPLAGCLRTAREASLEDPFLFFLALSMAEREIVLSHPAVNEQGNPTIPSPFLDEVRSCTEMATIVLDPTAVVPPAEACCETAELVGRAALDRWSRAPGAPPDRLTAALVAAGGDLAERVAAIDRRAAIEERRARWFLSKTLPDAFVGRLGGDLGSLPERIDAMRWSPHRLEALGVCAFKFYARYVLGLGEEDDPEAQVGPRERGHLAHAVLEQLYRTHERLPADLDAARALARDVLEHVREDAARRIPAKDPALLAVAWGQVDAVVDALVVDEHDERRRHATDGIAVEYQLETPVEFSLTPPGGGPAVVVAGTPDRVEVWRREGRAVGLRVLDYKMTRRSERYGPLLDPERQLGKTAFQIPVYLLGAMAAVGDLAPDAMLAGGYRVLLATKKDVSEEFTRADLERVSGQILALVERARGGRFDVDPDPCDPYCPYRPVCRYQRPPLEEEQRSG